MSLGAFLLQVLPHSKGWGVGLLSLQLVSLVGMIVWHLICPLSYCCVHCCEAVCSLAVFFFQFSAFIRTFKVTFSCIYEFVDFVVGGAHFCIQDDQIVKSFGVVICPLDEIVLFCHFLLLRVWDGVWNNGLEMVAFMHSVPMVLKWLILGTMFIDRGCFSPIGLEMVKIFVKKKK